MRSPALNLARVENVKLANVLKGNKGFNITKYEGPSRFSAVQINKRRYPIKLSSRNARYKFAMGPPDRIETSHSQDKGSQLSMKLLTARRGQRDEDK